MKIFRRTSIALEQKRRAERSNASGDSSARLLGALEWDEIKKIDAAFRLSTGGLEKREIETLVRALYACQPIFLRQWGSGNIELVKDGIQEASQKLFSYLRNAQEVEKIRREGGHLVAYAMKAVNHAIIDILRDEKKNQQQVSIALKTLEDSQPIAQGDPANAYSHTAIARELKAIFDEEGYNDLFVGLTPNDQIIWCLTWAGMARQDIAAVIWKSSEYVRKRIERTKITIWRRLKNSGYLEGYNPDKGNRGKNCGA